MYQLCDDITCPIESQVVAAVRRQAARGARDVQAERSLLRHHLGGDRLGSEPGVVRLGPRPSPGPWISLTNVGDSTTYDTQSAYVIPVQGTQATTYVFAADRWQDPDLVSSKYIWLPLKISGTSLALDYYAEWQLNVTTGRWSVNDGFLPQSGWKLLYADSQETQGENGAATNAFDDSSSTIWHTQYTGSAPAHPHELQIDLGATYALDGFAYLPRQDKDDHGMVAQYQFYASTDSTNWGAGPVATGLSLQRPTASEKPVMFTRKTARYIRFVALSEINDHAVGHHRRSCPWSAARPRSSSPDLEVAVQRGRRRASHRKPAPHADRIGSCSSSGDETDDDSRAALLRLGLCAGVASCGGGSLGGNGGATGDGATGTGERCGDRDRAVAATLEVAFPGHHQQLQVGNCHFLRAVQHGVRDVRFRW